jgi:5'-deoxynucleotidase YfbR-like HD superfamily hydrolase
MLEFNEIWRLSQIILRKQIRWKRFLKVSPGIRKQNVLQHTMSFSLFMTYALNKLRDYAEFDALLVLTACLIHDWGEGELAREIEVVDKSPDHDVQEYLAFCKRFQSLPKRDFEFFQRAFLLQFVFFERADLFPREAQFILTELSETHKYEARLFKVMEPLDYLMFALEQRKRRQNFRVINDVIQRNLADFDRAAQEIPCFEEVIWTPKTRQACLALLAE